MERVALHTRLKIGKESDYERVHAAIPAELDALLRANGVKSWRIYRSGRDLFHFVEVESCAAFLQAVEKHPVNVAWQSRMADLLEVTHDYSNPSGNALPLVWALP
ncbi:MAG TPA: L-rhamnose mutarotase [Candidatus Baltobacteraceae bacterium]|nr:L-rhamnose mutarotase [Candidatus Baltobacteraceae bacterium]